MLNKAIFYHRKQAGQDSHPLLPEGTKMFLENYHFTVDVCAHVVLKYHQQGKRGCPIQPMSQPLTPCNLIAHRAERGITMNEKKAKATSIVANQTAPVNTFEHAKRAFETAYASGDYAEQLTILAKAIAASVINKVTDPQRKAAQTADKVSDGGLNPALVAMKRGLHADNALLTLTAYNADRATRIAWTEDGDVVTETVDKDALTNVNRLCRETLSDAIDLQHTAVVALLEQAADHAAAGENWLDVPYTIRRLSKRVYIQTSDSAKYTDVETTPIQEVYRAVRRQIADNRAVQTDPRNGYTYVEMPTADEVDAIYYRSGRYSDIGGYDSMSNYTTDFQTVTDYEDILRRLNMTARQMTIVRLRMQGRGYKAIASYLGITQETVKTTVRRLRDKCESIGFTPAMWQEMTAE